jgi:hypothetical protein
MEDIYIAEPGKPEVKVAAGHDVTAAGANGKLYLLFVREGKTLLWSEGKAEQIGEEATFPTLAALPNGDLIAAWEHAGAIAIQSLSR